MYLPPKCQNKDCVYHKNPDPEMLIKKGKDKRKSGSVQRYQCKACGHQFTSASLSPVKFHNPELLQEIFLRYTSGYTVARLCEELGVSKATTLKMIKFMAKKCRAYHFELLATGFLSTDKIYFDEMISHIHGKNYPVSIGLAVDVRYKRIIDMQVADTRIRGKLPAKIIRELGKIPEDVANRPNNAPQMMESLMKTVKMALVPTGSLYSDKWPAYEKMVEKTLAPSITYIQEASKIELKDSVDKQGLGRFRSVCAYLRTYVGTMGRRSMNTAKSGESLEDHLYLTIARYNKYDLGEVLMMGTIKEDFYERQWRIKKELKQLKVLIAVLTYPRFLRKQERIRKFKATMERKKAEQATQLKEAS